MKDAQKKLTGRTLERAQAMQLLFQAESTNKELADVLGDNAYLVTDGPAGEYAEKLAKGVEAHADELEKLIAGASSNWDISRIGVCERLIMQIALYEARYVEDVDTSVAISEAVVLAKLFGTDDSYTFVNGILGAVARKEDK